MYDWYINNGFSAEEASENANQAAMDQILADFDNEMYDED